MKYTETPYISQCGANDSPCEEQGCQECCMHDSFDHDVCEDCGYERDPGIAIDRAMDYFEDR